MDMIRWLATNKVVVTVWGLGILAILLASIFGGGKKVDQEATAAVETKVVEATVEKAEPATAAVAATTAVATAAVASTAQTVVATASEVKVEAEKEVSAETQTAAADTSAASDTESASNNASQDATGSDSAADQSTAAVKEDDDLAGKSNDDLLMMAREAYWDNGLDKAAGLYSELITREPSVIEHKGELGNVFWRQGYPKKAAELYADIAEPMISSGNGERVSNMVGFIGLFFPERAANIRNLLDAQ